MEQLLFFSLLISISLFYVNCTTVTFSHGGQLLGKQFQYDGLAVDLFLGKLEVYQEIRSKYWKLIIMLGVVSEIMHVVRCYIATHNTNFHFSYRGAVCKAASWELTFQKATGSRRMERCERCLYF